MDNETKLVIEKIFIEEKKACEMVKQAEEKGKELIEGKIMERRERIRQTQDYILEYKRKEEERILTQARKKINEIEENKKEYLNLLIRHYEEGRAHAIEILSQTLLEELQCSHQH
ncbi:MAG: hypothetical protein ACMUJM_03515 [bacterium]